MKIKWWCDFAEQKSKVIKLNYTNWSDYFCVCRPPLVLPCEADSTRPDSEWLLSGLIRVWCQCLEFRWFYPLWDAHREEMAAVLGWNGGIVGLSWRGLQFTPPVFPYNTFFFWRENTKDACLTKLFAGPPPWEMSRPPPHSHTPCPPCLDWFSVHILEGITAICRLLRNKGGSSLSSLQYFRGITWPDKHALAPLYPCSLFCLDLSTHPNCPLYLKADHGDIFLPLAPCFVNRVFPLLIINCKPAHRRKTNGRRRLW